MDDNLLKLAAEFFAAKYFFDDMLIAVNWPWPEARAKYKHSLIQFAKGIITAMWVPVDKCLPEDKTKMLVRIPECPFSPEYYTVAYFDGEDWIDAQRSEVVRPSHYMPIPKLRKEVRHEH